MGTSLSRAPLARARGRFKVQVPLSASAAEGVGTGILLSFCYLYQLSLDNCAALIQPFWLLAERRNVYFLLLCLVAYFLFDA